MKDWTISACFFALLIALPAWSSDGCYAVRHGDTLSIGNSLVERRFVWNGGNLMSISLTDKKAGTVHRFTGAVPDFVMTQYEGPGTEGRLTVEDIPQTSIHPPYLKATVGYTLGTLQIRREFRVYSNAPVIACDTWLRGSMSGISSGEDVDNADRKNIESAADMESGPVTSVLDRVSLEGSHWHARAVEFRDVTDWNNNLVSVSDIISYRKNPYRGNLLFLENGVDGSGIFFLKEAPCSSVQLAYGGADFFADFGEFTVTGAGVTGKDITPDTWTSTYSCVTGVFSGGELEALKALRSYQKNIRIHLAERDEMVMMNTWGDRSQDTKVNESFCLSELEKAARLGITHFQIDDGWQSGKSPNSALAKGSFRNIWDNPDYWTPDPVKYPDGLGPVVDKGRELGIEIGLWFNPSVQNDFSDWEKDAAAIVSLYREYGIKVFKIDGLSIPSKQAEVNLRRLFDRVLDETDGQVVFNLDATAGRRGGYHMLNEYGNIFLENRYTDWQNYYPYWTLRNLWQLSRYVPAERLQIEFLNGWRNSGKYGDDPFAPSRYTFGYLFAVTMAAQPLAWMEASNLPEEAYSIRPLVEAYRAVQSDFHSGVILPVGEEPSGRSWTGFQSITGDDSGYLIVYREDNERSSASVRTWLREGDRVTLDLVLGNGRSFRTKAGEDGKIEFRLSGKNDFAMYRYEVKHK